MWTPSLQRFVARAALLLAGGFAPLTASAAGPGVAVLLIDTDRVEGTIDERIYGQFLEHINHSVVDGLYAEQVRGQGFEGKDFADYWKPFGTPGTASLVEVTFERGARSVRLAAHGGAGGVRQDRLYVEAGQTYDGSVWLKPEQGALDVSLRIVGSNGRELAKRLLPTHGTDWQAVGFEFASAATDRQASLEILASGTGSVLVDFWGRRRAANGHREPYRVPYIQIDNEPMNHGLSPEGYAAIVNLYGPRLRAIAPQSKIVACGQKRSNDMNWSQKVIDLAGANFDILGTHNYEYEPENYATGVRRIEDYLEKLADYVRISAHSETQIAVLEWGSSRTYDWRAGLHAAGSLLSYEKLSPALSMTSPALLMRNTSDAPEWRSWIYHDHVSWFAGSGYVAEKLFRDYYAPRRHAFTSGTFADI